MLAPAALFALVPLGGIIVLLYLLKLRRREQIVPSVFLWRRAVDDVQANAPFQRLRPNLLLLLQLLALAAVVVGLAAPFFMARRLPDRTVVVVLDASASMRATDVEGSRFEQARRRAREIVAAMGRRDEAALIVCGARPSVAVPMTGDDRRLLRALQRVEPTDAATNVRDGLMLGASLAAKRSESTVYLISDGGFGELSDVPGADVRFIAVGERNRNVAILAFEVSRPPGRAESQLFLRLRNYAPTVMDCELAIYHEDEVIDARRIELPADDERVESWEAAITEPGLMRAELAAEDDLAADNVAFAQAIPSGARSVLVVGPENLFLEQALVIQPGLHVLRADTLSAEQARAAYEEYDVVIFDRAPVPEPPERGAVMMIAATGWPELAASVERIEGPAITTWDEEHPALRYVNFRAIGIAEARRLSPGLDGEVIARAGDAPVAVALEREGLRGLAIGWDLLDSDLPLRVGFPVLLSNAVRWLGELRREGEVQVVRPGDTLRFAAPVAVTAATLVTPDGRRHRVEAGGEQIVLGATERVGDYRLIAGDRQWRWAVDLRDPDESDLAPGTTLELGGRTVASAQRGLAAERHLWPWLASLALVALVAEWYLYHRRY